MRHRSLRDTIDRQQSTCTVDDVAQDGGNIPDEQKQEYISTVGTERDLVRDNLYGACLRQLMLKPVHFVRKEGAIGETSLLP